VKISSPDGSIGRDITLKKDLRPGLVFIPMAINNNNARQLMGLTQLGETDLPGWNGCRVKIERI